MVAGLIAGNDADRGVWSSSAGVSSAVNDLTVPLAIGNPQLGQLDPVGVNSFRTVSNYGTVLWGDRTLAADDAGAERYLSVRRTADWIQRSLSSGLTWTARATNDRATWTSATAAVSAFLTDIWQAGALFGDDAEQAFRVTVDAATPAAMGVQVEAALVEPDEFLRITLTAPTLSG